MTKLFLWLGLHMNPTKTKPMTHFGHAASKNMSPCGYAGWYDKSLSTWRDCILQKVTCPKCNKSMNHQSLTIHKLPSYILLRYTVLILDNSIWLTSLFKMFRLNVQWTTAQHNPRLKHCCDDTFIPCTMNKISSLCKKVSFCMPKLLNVCQSCHAKTHCRITLINWFIWR
jgi:hypothetical protein